MIFWLGTIIIMQYVTIQLGSVRPTSCPASHIEYVIGFLKESTIQSFGMII
jgi:hypothetical protein